MTEKTIDPRPCGIEWDDRMGWKAVPIALVELLQLLTHIIQVLDPDLQSHANHSCEIEGKVSDSSIESAYG